MPIEHKNSSYLKVKWRKLEVCMPYNSLTFIDVKHSESKKNKNTMTKKIIGFAFLIIAFFLTIYFMYEILKNPNSLLIFKTLFSGELGLKWTLGVLLFHSFFFLILFLILKFGIKWTKALQQTELKN
jgi:hypothetical protein